MLVISAKQQPLNLMPWKDSKSKYSKDFDPVLCIIHILIIVYLFGILQLPSTLQKIGKSKKGLYGL